MTKPSQRRPTRYGQSGCMWSLINILDFRHGSRSTRRLLSDRRRGTRQTFDEDDSGNNSKLLIGEDENHLGNFGNESPILAASDASANKPSVKMLIEEEMGVEQNKEIKSRDPKLHNDQHEDRNKKSRKRNKRSSRGSLDFDAVDLHDGHESINSTPYNGSASKQNGNDIAMEEFGNHINQRGVDEVCLELKRKDSDLEVKEKLREAIKEFISREVANEKNLGENGRVNFSKEVVDALKVPNLDEESFLKLLRDPASFPMKSTEAKSTEVLDLCNVDRIRDSEELMNNNNDNKQRRFFRRHIKSPEMKSPKKGNKGSDSNTIIILKPGPSPLKSNERTASPDSLSDSSRRQQAERARAYLFLAEIKRRWKNVMGKEPHSNPLVKRPSFRFKGETPEKKSSNKDHFFIEKMAKPRDSNVGTESDSAAGSKQRVPNIYVEARRHLSEMIITGHEEANSSSGVKSPKTLARILALSEFTSPVPSPGRNQELCFTAGQMRPSGLKNDQSEKITENAEQRVVENTERCPSSLEQCPETEHSNIVNRDIGIKEEEASSTLGEDIASEAYPQDTIMSDEMSLDESRDVAPTCKYNETTSENPKQNVETDKLEVEFIHDEETPPSLFESPPSSSARKNDDESEILGDKPERQSPVSVLEPLFREEEDLSPARNARRSFELTIEPVEIKFEAGDNFIPTDKDTIFKSHVEAEEEEEETLLLYVRTVLRACGLNWNELYLKSQCSDQLLEPCLFGEADFFCNCPQYDQNLVFDCINEVLLEVCDQYFRFCPRVLYTKPIIRPLPDLKDAINELWGRIHWHLLQIPMPRTLEQIVRKDMSKNESWLDLRPDAESIGFETSDEILDDLIEDYVGESMDSLYASKYIEVEENENSSSS